MGEKQLINQLNDCQYQTKNVRTKTKCSRGLDDPQNPPEHLDYKPLINLSEFNLWKMPPSSS